MLPSADPDNTNRIISVVKEEEATIIMCGTSFVNFAKDFALASSPPHFRAGVVKIGRYLPILPASMLAARDVNACMRACVLLACSRALFVKIAHARTEKGVEKSNDRFQQLWQKAKEHVCIAGIH